jgi:hypothetical protein
MSVGVPKNVVRLDITMDDVLIVPVFESLTGLSHWVSIFFNDMLSKL